MTKHSPTSGPRSRSPTFSSRRPNCWTVPSRTTTRLGPRQEEYGRDAGQRGDRGTPSIYPRSPPETGRAVLLRGGIRVQPSGWGSAVAGWVATPGQVRLPIHRLRRRIHRQLADSLDPSPPARPAGRDGRPQPPPYTGAAEASPPVRWLRNYSNYLSPRLGFFSADSWTLLGIYLRNLALVDGVASSPHGPAPRPTLDHRLHTTQSRKAPLPGWANPALFMIGLGLAVIALIYLHLCRPYATRTPA